MPLRSDRRDELRIGLLRKLPASEWVGHETDETVDLAAMPWPFSHEELDWLAIPVDPMFLAGRRTLAVKGIGIGDPVYTVGLFRTMSGRERATPTLRSGIISMLPADRVRTKWSAAQDKGIEAYLIEAVSISGLSGGPLFCARTVRVRAAEHTGRQPSLSAHFLLGLPK
jgi:hypothetical protein